MAPPGQTAVFFIPGSFSAPAEWAQTLAAAGLVKVDRPEAAKVALVDFRAPDAAASLSAFRATATGTALPLIALVDGSRPEQLAAVVRADVSDFVAAPVAAEELAARIQWATGRATAAELARQRARDLSMLLELTADYAGSLDVEALLHDVTRKLAQEMNVDRAALVVLDEKREAGFIIAASDDAALKDLRIDLSRYPEIREVVRTGRPVTVADAASHPLLEDVKAQVAARGIRALAALPLAVQGRVLGVLLVRASAPRQAFTQREVDFLATVAHATAVALRNARLIATERGQTEREKSARIAAEERAKDLARYESYFAHVSEGIAILDEKACVLSINPAGSQMLDVTAAEARGRHVNALTNPMDDGALHELLHAVETGEAGRSLDLAARTLAGRRITLSISAAPLRDTSGSAILSFRDVTAQRRLADELRQTKEFQERLIDSSVDAIIASDLKGRVILYNKGAEAICGYPSAEALTQLNARDLYPPGVARDLMRRLREGRGRLTVTRQEILTQSGQRVPVNMTASIIYEGERELATVGIFTDLRDRMELEQQLSAAKDRLDEAEKNAVIVALAGTAAHELNQPLTSVMGYAELLRRKLKEGDFAYRPVDTIYREAERMAEIVRKIGKITRYETKVYVGSAQILDLDKASSHED